MKLCCNTLVCQKISLSDTQVKNTHCMCTKHDTCWNGLPQLVETAMETARGLGGLEGENGFIQNLLLTYLEKEKIIIG